MKQFKLEYVVNISEYLPLGISENVIRVPLFAHHPRRRMKNVDDLVKNCITARIRTEKNGVYLITLDCGE